MDNLTHSVTGLAIGELVDRCLPPEPDSALARVRHRLLLVSCWAASNFPDLDLVLTPLAPRPLGYLLQHRGHTHTLLGLLPQALLLLALVWLLWPRARALLRASPTARAATIGVIAAGLLLHVGMDYLNVYGVHPFYPFDARWVYGDMVFIVEPAFWVLLGTPLAMACGRTARRLWLGALTLALLTASYLGYLKWGSLLALAVAGFALAWLQRRKAPDAARPLPSRPRTLLAGFALLGVFLAGQAVGEQRARALVERQPRTGRLLDIALSAFPSNPLCWSFVSVAMEDSTRQLILQRGLLSLAPGLVPVASCAGPLAGAAPVPVGPTPAASTQVAWQWRESFSLAQLAHWRQADCALDAWLRFARTPLLLDGKATDVRFGEPGAWNFSTLQLAPSDACNYSVPRWGYPRADAIGVAHR
jgi:inner membrane protein